MNKRLNDKNYKKRLCEEYDQLLERYTKLSLFLRGNTKLKAIDFTLMHKQKEIMKEYIEILKRRIENLEDFKRYKTIILHHAGIIKN